MPARLNQHLQDSYLWLAIMDDDFLVKVAANVDSELFTSSLTRNLVALCYDYQAAHKAAPGVHFHDEVARFVDGKGEDETEEYIRYVERLMEMPTPNAGYVLHRTNDFVKVRSREIAVVQAADLLAEGQLEQADNYLYQALHAGIPAEENALNYLVDHSSLVEREAYVHMMPTGIPAMDRLIQGYDRGQLIVTLGGYKAGKTWWLMNLARTALSKGLHVLHLSFEVSMRQMEERYDMMLTRKGKWNVGEVREYTHFDGSKEGNDRFSRKEIVIESVHAPSAVIAARRTLSRFGGRLMIKKYPMGQCTPAEVERLLAYLETYEHFVPDVILLDYIDIMSLGGLASELRHQLNAGYIWAKGLADERNVLVATVSQVNRAALYKRHLTQKDVAEDARKVGNCDLMQVIGRDKNDLKRGLAGMGVIANRDGPQDCYCTFVPLFDVGQFCLSSWSSRYDKEMNDWAKPPDEDGEDEE